MMTGIIISALAGYLAVRVLTISYFVLTDYRFVLYLLLFDDPEVTWLSIEHWAVIICLTLLVGYIAII